MYTQNCNVSPYQIEHQRKFTKWTVGVHIICNRVRQMNSSYNSIYMTFEVIQRNQRDLYEDMTLHIDF
jgi:hypothetical protein